MATHWPYEAPDIPAEPFSQVRDATDLSRRVHHRYRSAVAFLDRTVGGWLEGVDLRENLVIITGDHGEALGDDGTLWHASRLSDVQTRVPLILAGPGVPPGTELDELTEHVDIAPTILELMGFDPRVSRSMHGRPWFRPGAPQREFVAVHHRAGKSDRPYLVALLGERRRFVLNIDPRAPTLELRGLLDVNGHIVGEPITPGDSDLLQSWLHDYLARVAGRNEPD